MQITLTAGAPAATAMRRTVIAVNKMKRLVYQQGDADGLGVMAKMESAWRQLDVKLSSDIDRPTVAAYTIGPEDGRDDD
eukprot:SAG22_NODE_6901_length_797_cov_0.945559_1_plen_79_part_00